MATAADRFEARVDTILENLPKTERPGGVLGNRRAMAVARAVRENPQLHQAYLEESNQNARKNRFRA